MWQFNDIRLNAHLLILQEREEFPHIFTIVMIADSHVNGGARNTNWLNKFEKLFVLGFLPLLRAQSPLMIK